MHKRVFISHHSKDDEHIGKLRNLLKPRGYELRNSSIDSSRPNNANNEQYIKSMLRPRIKWASICLVLISDTTHKREWVNWEIEAAAREGKRIIGVYCNSHSECDVPEALKDHADAIVGWRSERVVGAIDGEINDFERPNCQPMQPMFPSKYTTC